jgi:hypothetical protein
MYRLKNFHGMIRKPPNGGNLTLLKKRYYKYLIAKMVITQMGNQYFFQILFILDKHFKFVTYFLT